MEIPERINIARNKSMQEIVIEKEWLGRKLTFKTGKLAKQADAAVTVQYGDTVVRRYCRLGNCCRVKKRTSGNQFFSPNG
jgi:polyribonucleotide nucleotidyltransferase